MNAEFLGRWDVAPRGHPGDGRVEVLDADLPLGDRVKARSRLRTGTHLPHPDIATRSVRAWQSDLAPPLDVWLDGTPMGRAEHLSVRVEPDALTVVV
jgi:diacylglycerol kinase family enzyme